MNNEKYNGWTNHATWLVALHIDNDETLYNDALELVEQHDCELSVYEGSMELKNWLINLVNEVANLTPNNALVYDLINATLDEVNWVELFTYYTEK